MVSLVFHTRWMVAGWPVGVSTKRFVFGMWRRVNSSIRLQGIQMVSLVFHTRRMGVGWPVGVEIERYVFGMRRRVNSSIRSKG